MSIFGGSLCFYANKSGSVKEAARNLTNRALRIRQHLSNSWENWLSNWNWMPWVLPFLGPLLLLTLILSFCPCLMSLFFKISSGPLTSLHQLNYPRATSNSLRLSKTSLTRIPAFSHLIPRTPLSHRKQLQKTDLQPLS